MSKTVETFLFEKWPVEVHRRPFRRTLSIYLYPNKPIKVVANNSTSQKFVIDFLKTKEVWIEKNYQRMQEIVKNFPAKNRPDLWDGRTSSRILIHLQKYFGVN